MFLVYVSEAHPEDEWQLDSNLEEGVIHAQPTSYEQRTEIAKTMLRTLDLSIPTLIDGMDDAAVDAFAAWPERLFDADSRGKIAFAGGPGPFGFDPSAAQNALEELLQGGSHPSVFIHKQIPEAKSNHQLSLYLCCPWPPPGLYTAI